MEIHTIDLEFQGRPGAIACYLVTHDHGCIMVECGPGSTIPNLINSLRKLNYELSDVTDVFLTHIHLDHAGTAGWLATQGVNIHVHPHGAPHLLSPEKLLASAAKIYGDLMGPLWGEFLPVPAKRLVVMQDGEVIQIGGLTIKALDVPGHANHHYAYLIGDACFSGDIGGVRMNEHQYLSLPMPPPELHIEKWRESILRIQRESPRRIIPTHFGIYHDVDWHLGEVLHILDEVETWMSATLPANPTLDILRQQFIEFERRRTISSGFPQSVGEAQQIANPSFMSADGIQRYWNKHRTSS